MPIKRSAILFGVVFLLFASASAQTIPISNLPGNNLRAAQLNGLIDPDISFTVQPLVRQAHEYGDSLNASNPLRPTSKPFITYKNGKLAALPVTLTQQFNTHHPYGWNDGAMIAAKGYQSMISGGFYAELGALEVHVQPEFVFASNPSYERTTGYGSSTASFSKLYPGQSKISLSFFGMSGGLSTQNLWWGPGIHSSLLMSNNAPGFLHGFFSSRRPVKTPIGSFEWQLIGAKLTATGSYGYENFNLTTQPFTGSRYLNAYVVSYHPKWVPGLFLGMTRGLQRYRADIDRSGSSLINKYLPILTKAFQKQNAVSDDTMRTDQLASFFLRWMFVKAQAEFYVEYGFNDYNQNVRDYLMGPTHSAAYIIGAKKIVDLPGKKYLDLGLELTQMSQAPEAIVRDAGNWYVHGEIREGYTNENQILGAGAGLGCNVQTLSASLVDGAKQFGIMFERVERDPQYHLNKWVDFSVGVLPQWRYGKMVVSGKFQFINSSNYIWQKDVNRFNLHSRVAIQYLF